MFWHARLVLSVPRARADFVWEGRRRGRVDPTVQYHNGNRAVRARSRRRYAATRLTHLPPHTRPHTLSPRSEENCAIVTMLGAANPTGLTGAWSFTVVDASGAPPPEAWFQPPARCHAAQPVRG